MANYGSITIQFGIVGDAGKISIELDEEMNQGKTQFAYGSKAYFQVYADPGLTVHLIKTDGILTNEGVGTRTFDEQVQFIDSQTAELGKPIRSIESYQWYGQDLGNITKTGIYQIKCAQSPDITQGKIGITKVSYKADFTRYAISVPNKGVPEYPVLIVAVAA
ncbi:MAG: hypothetical protein PHC35_01640 [Deltaproteobacteria bacterium]|nr:hypothetical protein [Deltaproteobacteria bacterium]